MSSGGGGGGGVPADTTNVQTIREAPEIEARRLGLMDAATELAKTATSPPAFQVAPMSAAEQARFNFSGSDRSGSWSDQRCLFGGHCSRTKSYRSHDGGRATIHCVRYSSGNESLHSKCS